MSLNENEESLFDFKTLYSSLPSTPFTFKEELEQNELPLILLMGLTESGKTSIQKVVFERMTTNETLYLDSNECIKKYKIQNSFFVNLKIHDFPGHFNYHDPDCEMLFSYRKCSTLIYVIDAQDDLNSALSNLISVIKKAYLLNNNIRFDVFIHKTDMLTDDNKFNIHRQIVNQTYEELSDYISKKTIFLTFHLTSIYDQSVFEAFSKIIQRMVPYYQHIENFLNIITTASGIEKSFLFDVKTKIYIATDSSPVDLQCYELCCSMIDLAMDLSNTYSKEQITEATFDESSSCLIKLNNGIVLYLKQMSKLLALVCIVKGDCFEKQRIIDYNYSVLRKGMSKLFDIILENRKQNKDKDTNTDTDTKTK